ncbi:MAG: D-glycero-beta-D-manno-heptose-7-phosphate kinase [Elusimicrobia bacterium]|nr:D-glycero-beta-D-manno-heptose-7-phosphate kinase [Elusimicrobiota bacterium]
MNPGPRALRRFVARFKDKRILVVGDLMLDQYVRGSVSRISPEAPVPVVRVTQESFIPGGAGNVADNLASLGALVSVVGVVGDDEAGRELTDDLRARRVSVDGVITDRWRVTSQKCRIVAERQQVVRFDRETAGALSHETEQLLLKRLCAAVSSAQAVILSDYGKGVISPKVLASAIRQAKDSRIPITVDPKIEHFRRYRGVSCLTPNLQEAWAGMRRPPKPGLPDLESLGRDILRALRSESLLITRGPDGMSLFNRGGRVVHIPTRAREVFDVTGAGDTVISVLTLALAAGASIFQAAQLANHAAGIVVGKLGTAVTTADELLEVLK